MPRFAANISTLFQELPFLERIDAARRAGFEAVECQFPYEAPAEAIRERLNAAGLELVLLNTPPGDFEAGERGLAGVPGRQDDFRAALDRALTYAGVLDCPKIHVMAGIVGSVARREACLTVLRGNLRFAADLAAREGRTLLVEPINAVDVPGYLVDNVALAAEVIDALAHPNVRLQLDFYHLQMSTGRLVQSLEEHRARIGHVQFAGVPGRHEPDECEIDYAYVFRALDRSGYDGWVGCEYVPRAGTEAGLGWLRAYGIEPRTAEGGGKGKARRAGKTAEQPGDSGKTAEEPGDSGKAAEQPGDFDKAAGQSGDSDKAAGQSGDSGKTAGQPGD